MDVPPTIRELVERFARNREEYRASEYKEDRLRVEFLDPFFEALGWDVRNTSGAAEAYKDVVHEDALKIGQATEAPDYCFRIGGTRKFFVEAKKPSVDIRNDPAPAYQLRRYAWSAKLPVSILTDFEELAVYDCRIRPRQSDKAATARILLLTCDQYAEKWEEIAAIFSKDAILKGAFDRFAESGRGKRGTAAVDEAFLEEIESWRHDLARDIARHNPRLSNRDLNYAVGKTIDRIIFLRIAEDRGLEDHGRLLSLVNGDRIYPRLVAQFRAADERYNSGLFHFRKEEGETESPDGLTPTLQVDDDQLRGIIKRLYYPESPYEFSVLPTEILGQVYEQFLGHVIRLTPGHQAKVEEKPEVKKAGGVYYTPGYIVEYIVRNTVGKLLEGRTPMQVARDKRRPPLRVVDPACGSGSFLIGAYQFLLDWYRDRYVEEGAEAHRKEIYRAARGAWRLTTAERKRILLDHIYGVDIDPQAVEVTKLSLLLKVLEGETRETLGRQARLWRERALPDLGANIKCGNSLIAPDFYANHQTKLFDEEERYRVNAFDWKAEFSQPVKAGGFDVVLGNPPWGADVQELEKPYLRARYALNIGKYESYMMFLEKGTALLSPTGLLGFIVPTYWISRSQTESLRQHLCGTFWPRTLIVLPENVFTQVKMDSCILVLSRTRIPKVICAELTEQDIVDNGTSDVISRHERTIETAIWASHARVRFNPRVWSADVPLLSKIESNTIPLGTIVEITQGLTLYRRSTLVKQYGAAKADEIITKRLFHSSRKKNATFKRELLGRDVGRFHAKWNGESWVSYGPWLAHAVDERFFRGPRLVVQKIRNPTLRQRLVAGYLDDLETYSAGVLLNVIPRAESRYSLLFVLGLLNSALLNYWYRKVVLDVSVRVVDLGRLPICRIDWEKEGEKGRHDQIVDLVERMLELDRRIGATRVPGERMRFEREMGAVDRRIDDLVYALYGVGGSEIEMVRECQE